MKKIIAFALVFVLLAFTAMADLSLSDIKLGSDSQQRGQNTTASLTIKNTGNNIVNIVHVGFSQVDAKFQMSGSLSGVDIVNINPSARVPIAPGSSVTLTLKGFVPLNFDAVDDEGKKVSFNIGGLVVGGEYANGTTVAAGSNLFMEAENKLEFGTGSEIKIGTSAKSLRDDKEFKDVKRDDNIDISVEVKNRFSNSGDCEDESRNCDIDGIDAKMESRDSDIDVDEDLNFDSIGSDDDDTDSVSFSIPDDIDEQDYDIDVWMTGEDENGALHGDFWTFTLKVEVANDQVDITNFDLSPETLSCNDRKTSLSVSLKNTGSSDQDEVSIFIDSTKLDIKDSIYNIVLDEGDFVTRSFDLDLPSKLSPGTYFIQIIANVNSDEETDRQSATLTIAQCEKPATGTNTTVNPPANTGNTEVKIVEVPPTSGVIYGKPKTGTADTSVWFVAALFAIAIMLFLILVVVLLRR